MSTQVRHAAVAPSLKNRPGDWIRVCVVLLAGGHDAFDLYGAHSVGAFERDLHDFAELLGHIDGDRRVEREGRGGRRFQLGLRLNRHRCQARGRP